MSSQTTSSSSSNVIDIFSGYSTSIFSSEECILSSTFVKEIDDLLPKNKYSPTSPMYYPQKFYTLKLEDVKGDEKLTILDRNDDVVFTIVENSYNGQHRVIVRLNTHTNGWINFSSFYKRSIQDDILKFIQKSDLSDFLTGNDYSHRDKRQRNY